MELLKPIDFINNIFKRFPVTDDQYEAVRKIFRSGYCWHFAHMLKDTYQRGQVCLAAPFGHFVWQDEDEQCYDIEGVYAGEAFYYISEQYIPKYMLEDFLHRTDEGPDVTKESIIAMIKSYCEITHTEYDSRLEKYLP